MGSNPSFFQRPLDPAIRLGERAAILESTIAGQGGQFAKVVDEIIWLDPGQVQDPDSRTVDQATSVR